MQYRIAKIEMGNMVNTYDVHIEKVETGEIMVADGMKVWEEDEYSLAYMFRLVETGAWGDGVLSDEDEAAFQAEFGAYEAKEYDGERLTYEDIHKSIC